MADNAMQWGNAHSSNRTVPPALKRGTKAQRYPLSTQRKRPHSPITMCGKFVLFNFHVWQEITAKFVQKTKNKKIKINEN